MTGLLLTSSGSALLVGGLAQLAVPAGEITVRTQQQSLGVAPHAVTFEVDSWTGWDTATSVDSTIYNPCMHDLVYLWDFDDPTSPAFTAQNVLSQWTDSNKAYGYAVAHVYRTPGTYHPSCLVIEPSSGKSYTWTHPGITVADPDTFFTDANTFWVDHTATYTGKPAAATGYTSLATAMNALTGRSDPTRIVVADGHTETGFSYTAPNGEGTADGTGFLANHSQGVRNYYVRMVDGYTTRASITCSGKPWTGGGRLVPRTDGQLIDFVFEGLNFTGPWDAVRLEGSATVQGFELSGDSTTDQGGPPDAILMLNCKVRGFGINLSPGTNATAIDDGTQIKTPRNISICILQGVESSGYQGYTMFAFGRENPIGTNKRQTHAWLGVQFASEADDVDGAGGAFPYNHTVSTFRGGFRSFIVDGSSVYSGAGNVGGESGTTNWTGGKKWFMAGRQGCMRFGLNAPYDAHINIQRSYWEGQIGFQGESTTTDVMGANIVFEKNLVVVGLSADKMIGLRGRNATFRNNVLLWPEVSPAPSSAFFYLQSYAPFDSDETFGNIRYIHNTLINLNTTATPIVVRDEHSVATYSYTETNTLRHEPGPGTPITYAPVALSGSAITPFSAGGRNPCAEAYEGVVSDFSDQGDGIVENGETMTISYSEGDASYFKQAGDYIRIAGAGIPKSATFAFGASSVTITNTSGETWGASDAALIVLLRDPDHYPPKVTSWTYGSGTVGIYAPTTGSSAIGGGTTSFPRFDILGANRKTIIDGLTRTNATLGAVEVNLES